MPDSILTNTYVGTGPTGTNLERESLGDVVQQVYIMEAPHVNNMMKGQASSLREDWGTEDIPAITVPTAHKQGYVTDINPPNTPTRLHNWCELVYESGGVSHTKQALDEAGDTNTLDHQRLIKGRILLRKINKLSYYPQAMYGVAEPFLTATPISYVTNIADEYGTPGTKPTGDGTDTYVFGSTPDDMDTIAPFTTVLQASAYFQGSPRAAFMSPARITDFSRIPDASIVDVTMQIPAVKNPTEGTDYFAFIGAVGMYQSDFGVIEKIKDLDADPRYVLIEDPDYIEIRYLPGMDMNEYEIGKRGSGDEFAIESQFCFAVTLPQAMAAITGYKP